MRLNELRAWASGGGRSRSSGSNRKHPLRAANYHSLYDDETVRSARLLAASGLRIKEVARRLNVPHGVVRYWSRGEHRTDAGGPFTPYRSRNRSRREVLEARQRAANGEAIGAIARSMGIARSTIRSWVLGLGRRDVGGPLGHRGKQCTKTKCEVRFCRQCGKEIPQEDTEHGWQPPSRYLRRNWCNETCRLAYHDEHLNDPPGEERFCGWCGGAIANRDEHGRTRGPLKYANRKFCRDACRVAAANAAGRRRCYEEVKPCAQCGSPMPKEYEGGLPMSEGAYAERRYCSHACWAKSREVPVELRFCERCGKAIPRERPGSGRRDKRGALRDNRPSTKDYAASRFCGKACADAGRRKTFELRPCEVCGKPIPDHYPGGAPVGIARYATRRVCGKACQAALASAERPRNQFGVASGQRGRALP